jgi:hypothetical protein
MTTHVVSRDGKPKVQKYGCLVIILIMGLGKLSNLVTKLSNLVTKLSNLVTKLSNLVTNLVMQLGKNFDSW